MTRYDELDADLDAIFAEIGIDITWAGGSYPAVISDPQVNVDLELGGFMADADFEVKLRKATLPTPWPAARDIVTIQGTNYAIKATTDNPSHPLLVLQVVRA